MTHRFAGVLLVDARGWVLLQERDEHARIAPNKWGLPGGHVEEGEEFEPAAYRELAEETGLSLPSGALSLWHDMEFFHVEYDSMDRMQTFIGRADVTDADIVVGEGRRIVFVEPEVARALDLTPSAAIVVPLFLDSPEYAGLTG